MIKGDGREENTKTDKDRTNRITTQNNTGDSVTPSPPTMMKTQCPSCLFLIPKFHLFYLISHIFVHVQGFLQDID